MKRILKMKNKKSQVLLVHFSPHLLVLTSILVQDLTNHFDYIKTRLQISISLAWI